jgi:hypothetical protein
MPSKNQTVTSKSDPWEDAQPYILAALEGYQELFESDPNGDFTVEARDEYTIQAEELVIARVDSGDAVMVSQAAQAALLGIVSAPAYSQGANLYANVEALVVPTITAQFAGANRIGGALYALEMARGLTESFAPIALQARQMELQSILNVAAVADKVDTGAMLDVKLLAGVGSDRETYAKRLIDAPYVQKSRWLDVTGAAGGFGGTNQTTSNNRGAGIASSLGGALSGAATGFSMGGPFGALIGGGLGLLSGLV